MSKPQLPALTHLQFLVLGVLRNDEQPGRALRGALSGYGIRRTGPAFYQLMARLEKDRLVDGRYEQIDRRRPGRDRAALPHQRRRQAPLERGARVLRTRGPRGHETAVVRCLSSAAASAAGCRETPSAICFIRRWKTCARKHVEGIRLRHQQPSALWLDCWQSVAELRPVAIRGDARHVAFPLDSALAFATKGLLAPCLFRMFAAPFACFGWSRDSPLPRC